MQKRRTLGIWIAAIVSHLACVAAVDAGDLEPPPAWIGANESIVVLESPQFHFDWNHRKLPLPIDLFRCATQAVHAKYPRVRLVSQSEFVKLAFPDLEPQAAPVNPESLRLLADNSTLQERIAPLHVRYLVYGGTENDIETVFERFGCNAAVCGVGAEWKKRSSYHAFVIDLKSWQESAADNAASGTSWMATILTPILPLFVGWKSPTESRACVGLGRDVLALLDARAEENLGERSVPR